MVRGRCLNAKLEPPHNNTVRNRINKLSDELKLAKRRGRKVADQQYAPIEGSFPGADYPLSVIQIDHTKLDVILVDDIHRRPIGRPWITLAIEVFSRMVAGLRVLSIRPARCRLALLAHGILPKDEWLAKNEIGTDWPLWGLPAKVHADNAKEFKGSMLQRACAQYGIDLEWRPVARPHFGGDTSERLLGTVLQEIHSLPGTTFSNTRARGDYDSDGKAIMTLTEFERWLATYIVEVYHQRNTFVLGQSPLPSSRKASSAPARNQGQGCRRRSSTRRGCAWTSCPSWNGQSKITVS
ncbi:MAG: DDE-type integrase/transposase/recombinase [Zoogloea sp.]|nr:DDE-type integrase/transposase/recombinase [Zoogloea sp.]